jgi:hypothetical protein
VETASERAEFPVQAGNDISAKWPSEGMRATDRAHPTRHKAALRSMHDYQSAVSSMRTSDGRLSGKYALWTY